MAEVDTIISRWAHLGANVVFAEELGDFAIFTQRRGRVELARPGVPVHRAGETYTTRLVARFAEIVFVEDDAYEALLLRRPAGVNSQITLIAESTRDLEPDDVLLMVHTARSVRRPAE